MYRAGKTGESNLDPYTDDKAFFGGNWPLKTWLAFMKPALDGVHKTDFPEPNEDDIKDTSTPTFTPPPSTPDEHPAAQHTATEHPAAEHAAEHAANTPTSSPTRTKTKHARLADATDRRTDGTDQVPRRIPAAVSSFRPMRCPGWETIGE